MVEAIDKKRKVVEKPSKVSRPSKIFSPFRVVGNVSNEIPFALGTLGSTFYIVTCVGRSFQIYDAATLHLLFVSQQQTPSKITCLAANFQYVYAAYGNQIGVFKRGRLEHTLTCETNATVHQLLPFGEYLIAGSTDGSISVFKKSGASKTPTELYATLHNINVQVDGDIVGIVHPPTYLNKIVVATTSYIMVFNIRTGKLLFKSPDEQFMENISAIEIAPALDILAVGTAVGNVYMYNIRKGKVLGDKIICAAQDLGAKVVSISFRTDGSPHLVAGLNTGHLFFYDLACRSRVHILTGVHKESHGGVANVKFLNGQPILVSNGGDNQLKEHVFDPAISTSNSSIVSPPRHLRSRGGHAAPPIAIEFPNEEKTHFLYSASRDRTFWSFSLRKDAQAQEMSQRAQRVTKNRKAGIVSLMREKFPEITAISSSQARENDWDNILTVHKDENFARTWSSKSKRVGKHELHTIDGGLAKAVCVSHCGNFGLVGSSKGGIGSFNLQSGLLRKKYVLHRKEVTGLAMDGMNRKMVSCGLDGIVGFYNFSELKYLGKIQLEAPITHMVYQKSSDLAAFALDDLSIVVVDVVTQKVVRVLYGHSNRITGMDFSPDGRWIVSCALDATLRTWDLPTGGCIDGVRLPNVATSVRFSPLGDMLATTHVSGTGISLWTNRSQFVPVSVAHVEEEEFATMLLPNVSGDGGATVLDGALDESENDTQITEEYKSIDQIDSLVTLALGTRSKYSTLLHLDVIKQRNKPVDAVKKPEKTPFFLSLTGEAVGDRASVAEGAVASETITEEESGSKLVKLRANGSHNFESEFTKLLRQCSIKHNYAEFLQFLVDASPSTIDVEIRSLNTFAPLDEMANFVEALCQGLELNQNYDILQAVFSLFLKNHGDVIHQHGEDSRLQQQLDRYGELNKNTNDELDELVKYCLGVTSFLQTV